MRKSANRSKTSSDPGYEKVEEGVLIILSAPSGCGKTTVVDRLLKRHPRWVRSISATTRVPRAGEKNGEDYFFVNREGFRQMEDRGELMESAEVFGHEYGTPKVFVTDCLRKGHDVVLAIDTQGTKKIKKIFEGKVRFLTIFILPPSVKALRERLEGRKTESAEEIQRRMDTAQDEIKEAGMYDFTVVNQNVDQTVVAIEGFVEKFKKGRR